MVDGRGEGGLVGWILGLALHSHSDSISLTITPLALHHPIPPFSPSLPTRFHSHPCSPSLTHSLCLLWLRVGGWMDGCVGWAWSEWAHGWFCCIRLLGHSLYGSLLGRWWGWVCVWFGWCVCAVSVVGGVCLRCASGWLGLMCWVDGVVVLVRVADGECVWVW